jgi:WD40 repeat protein
MEAVGNPLSRHAKGVRCLTFSPDSTHVMSGSEDLHIHMTDIETQQSVLTLVNHADWITSISFNPMQPKYFVTTSLDKTVKVW